MSASTPLHGSRFCLFAGVVLLVTNGLALAWMTLRVDRLEEKARPSSQSPRVEVIEQEGVLVKCTDLGSHNSAGFVEFQTLFDAPPVITLYEEPPKEYFDLAAKEHSTGIKQHLITPMFPEGDDPVTWSVGRQVRAFEKRMAEFSGSFQFRPTGTGFGWSIDHSKFELPLYPFPFPVVDGKAVNLRTVRWRARGIKVVEAEGK
jgi:hypothetical protein